MELAKLILEYIKALIYPTLIGIILWIFRKHIVNLVNSITKFKGFGIDAEFEKRIDAKLQEIKDDFNSTDANTLEAEKRISNIIAQELKSVLEKGDQINPSNQTSVLEKYPEIKLNTKNNTMLVFAVGLSLKENLKYNIYYDPVDRNHNYSFKYIGLYFKGEIVAVGELKKIVYCDYDEDTHNLIPTDGRVLNITEDETNRIKDTIIYTDYYELEKGNKFFLVDKYYGTHFKKNSDSGIRAKKYFWLNEIEGFNEGMSAEELAILLNNRTWE
jgi:hypothetical protein